MGEFIPSWNKINGKLVLLDKISTIEGTSVLNNAGERVNIFKTDGSLVWNTQEELKKIDLDINIGHLLYHSSGLAVSSFYSPIQIFENHTLNYNLIFQTVFNYPNTIGLSIANPGDTITYDMGHVLLPGVIEIIYNNLVNKIPVDINMENNSNFIDCEEIFSLYFDEAFKITKDVDYKFATHNDEEIARLSQPYINQLKRPSYGLVGPPENYFTELTNLKAENGDNTPILTTP